MACTFCFFVAVGLANFLPGLALNYDPPLSTSHVTLSISAKLQDAADVAGP
jgi:hypothetical protein